jgi:hypothetical protein
MCFFTFFSRFFLFPSFSVSSTFLACLCLVRLEPSFLRMAGNFFCSTRSSRAIQNTPDLLPPPSPRPALARLPPPRPPLVPPLPRLPPPSVPATGEKTKPLRARAPTSVVAQRSSALLPHHSSAAYTYPRSRRRCRHQMRTKHHGGGGGGVVAESPVLVEGWRLTAAMRKGVAIGSGPTLDRWGPPQIHASSGPPFLCRVASAWRPSGSRRCATTAMTRFTAVWVGLGVVVVGSSMASG